MSEIDVFETRFATAYRRYLDEVPTEVDAVAVARAVAAGHRRTRRLTWPWAVRPAPALAWLVLIGLLVAALAAALVFVSAPRPAIGIACPAGTHPEAPGPADQARPPMAYVAPMAFDRRAGRIVLLAEGYAGGLAETWTFDVCTNTWTRMHPDREPSGVMQIVYDVDSDRTITLGNGRVWGYDLEADSWTPKGLLPIAISRQPRLVYDPATGLVLVQTSTSETESLSSELWSYDIATDAWTALAQTGAPNIQSSHEGLLALDPSIDRLVSYDRIAQATRLFDLHRRTWSTSSSATPNLMFGWGPSGGEIAYDGAAARTVVFSYGRVIAYDAVADRWDVLVEGWDPDQGGGFSGPTCLWMPWMVDDPVNQRLVVYGGQYPTPSGEGVAWVQSDQVLALDLATREWRTLLGAEVVQPAPS